MSRILDLKKAVQIKEIFEKDFNADVAQTKLIDLYHEKFTSTGHRPELLIGGGDAINQFLKRHYPDYTPDWQNGVYIYIDGEDESTVVRVLISNLQYNELFLI